jgi:3-methyladenine DNA glycosylase AlkC
MEPLKNTFNHQIISKLASYIKTVYASFDDVEFINSIFDNTWDSLELKDRVNHITVNLRRYLPSDYPTAISIIDKVVTNYGTWLEPLGWFFPTFVEFYGQDEKYWDISISALARYTEFASSEFAVRPFIIKHQTRMMKQMYAWSKSENEHVRRLSSEGCRPALPWAMALNEFKKDPTPIIPILEQLKADDALYVRKSVANNLNDISKTHPDLVIKMAKDWYGKNEKTDWIVKHACRTLLKKGNKDALNIFGFEDANSVKLSEFSIDTEEVTIGGDITFSFLISTQKETKIRLEYFIDYMKSNGKTSKKIFKISEITLKGGEEKKYVKKHSFANLTTRKHYIGKHAISLVINGLEYEQLYFELKNKT